MKRHQILRVAGAAVAAGIAHPAFAQTSATVRVGAFPAEVSAEVFYGREAGFFAKAGLNVDVQIMNNGSAIAAAISGDAIDVGLSDLVSVISAHAHGLPFLYIAAGLQWSVKAPTLLPVVAEASPIRGPKDFDGKTVTVNGLGNIAQLPFQAWIDKNGGNSKSVKFLELPFPAMLPALARGTVDAMVCPEPFITGAVKAGNRVVPVMQNPLAPAYLLSGYIATSDWIAKNAALAKHFADAVRAAGDWANANPTLAAPILAKSTNIPLPVVEAMYRGQFQDRLDPALIQPVIDAAVRYGVIAKPFPAGEIIANLH
jgi:NitT/TauT family transport system substrate-binding protein